MDPITARLMADYRVWADALTYRSVGELPSGEAHKVRRTLFGSIIGTLTTIFWSIASGRRTYWVRSMVLPRVT
jgi:uncharacterized damage-inducible protein DinB